MNILKIDQLRNAEFIALGKDFISLIDSANPVTLGINAAYGPFKTEWLSLDSFFVLERGSILTDDLVALDARRDNAIVGLRMVIDGFSRHFDPAFRAASERLLAAIDKYGTGINRLNLLAETEVLRNLVSDLEGNSLLQNALTVLGLKTWVTELKDANNAFNQVYLQRTQETSAKPNDSLASRRKPAIELYRKLVKTIEAKNTLDPSPALSTLMGQLNGLIDKYNLLVAARSTAGKEEEKPAEEA
jgi:hypothetical protein